MKKNKAIQKVEGILESRAHETESRHITTPNLSTSDGVIKGYAALYNTPFEFTIKEDGQEIRIKEVIRPGAFTQELINRSDVHATLNHNKDIVLARSKYGVGTMQLTADQIGLRFEFTPGKHRADIAESVERSDIDQGSFRYEIREQRITPQDGYILREMISFEELDDICIATKGAYKETKTVLEKRTLDRIEQILRSTSEERSEWLIQQEIRERDMVMMEMGFDPYQ